MGEMDLSESGVALPARQPKKDPILEAPGEP